MLICVCLVAVVVGVVVAFMTKGIVFISTGSDPEDQVKAAANSGK